MSEFVEVEVDDVHKFMVKEIVADDVSLEEFVNNIVEQSIYSTYQQVKEAQAQQGTPAPAPAPEETE